MSVFGAVIFAAQFYRGMTTFLDAGQTFFRTTYFNTPALTNYRSQFLLLAALTIGSSILSVATGILRSDALNSPHPLCGSCKNWGASFLVSATIRDACVFVHLSMCLIFYSSFVFCTYK